jgi:integrase
MPASVYKICKCRNQTKCRHPWWFSFKRRDEKQLRKSLDVVLERRIDSKIVAEEEAGRLRTAIRATLDDPASPALTRYQRELFGLPVPPAASALATLTMQQLLDTYYERHLKLTATSEKRKYEIGAIARTKLPTLGGPEAALGEWLVVDVTADTLERLRETTSVSAVHKTSEKRSNAIGGPIAANRNLRLLRAAFNWAIDKGLIERTPFKRGDRTTVKLTRELARSRRLQSGEAERLLAACHSTYLRALIEAALETGCRRGELLSLQWQQVQLEPRPELWLPAGKTKTGRARRVVVSTRLKTILEMRRDALRTALELQHAEILPGSLYVFGNELGQRHGAIKTAWRLTCERAKIHDLHFHDLRREAGSRWMEGGVPLATIQKWLGHTNIAQTSTYLATTAAGEDEQLRRYEERIGRLIPIDTKGGKRRHKRPRTTIRPNELPEQNTTRH